jgi:hypothetical protein
MKLRVALVILFFVVCFSSFASGDDLEVGVKWSIFHEGCLVYKENVLNDIGVIRQCIFDNQKHNTPFESILAAANDATLLAAVKAASISIPQEFDLKGAMQWVMYHEGQAKAFREDLRNNYIGSIRSLYKTKQSRNPNARNLLAAVSDDYIRNLINSL